MAGFGGLIVALAALLYARARVAQFEKATYDLDWQQVSELTLDVAKLKKASQKWQNNMNAQEAVSLKNLKEQALVQNLMQQNGNAKQVRRIDM